MASKVKLELTSPIKIESNVPCPLDHRNARRYPWDQMEIGDSFFLPHATPQSIACVGRSWGKRRNVKFSVRAVVENGVEGTRVWRIM